MRCPTSDETLRCDKEDPVQEISTPMPNKKTTSSPEKLAESSPEVSEDEEEVRPTYEEEPLPWSGLLNGRRPSVDDSSYCLEEEKNDLRASDQDSQSEDLGGWGSTGDVSWLQSSASGSRISGDTSSSSSSGSVNNNSYEHAWQQIAQNAPVITAQRTRSIPERSSMELEAGDGWGEPKNIVSWQDERLAYAHEVLEKQKRTTFWNKEDNGEWKELGKQEDLANLQRSVSHSVRRQPKSTSSLPVPRRRRSRSTHEHASVSSEESVEISVRHKKIDKHNISGI